MPVSAPGMQRSCRAREDGEAYTSTLCDSYGRLTSRYDPVTGQRGRSGMTQTGNCLVGPDEEPDKYQLVGWMAGGGEADLWEASVTLASDQEQVAIKILHPDHFKDVGEWHSRWSEQVDLLRLIQHPGVVGVHCHFAGARMHLSGQADLTDRTLYMVMNWVEGQALQDWVPLHHHPDNQAESLRYLSQVAAVLDCLHTGQATSSRRTILHGDISPANVIINPNGQAVLVDFGLFRIAAQYTAEVVAGTPGYCAPEVLQQGQYSVASDRYAFGALAYFVLTGQHPPSDLSQLREGACAIPWLEDQPERIEHLLTMFAEEPESRPPPGEWIRGLRMHASTVLPGSAPLLPLPPRRGRGTSPDPPEDAAATTAEPAAQQWSRSAFVTIFVLLAVLAGYVAVRESHQQQAARPDGASPALNAGSVVPSAPTKAPIAQTSPTSPIQEPSTPSEQPRELSLTDVAPVETDNG